jgi:hypothetical protein
LLVALREDNPGGGMASNAVAERRKRTRVHKVLRQKP